MIFALSLYTAFVAALTVAEYREDRRAQWLLKPACALGFILIALQSGALETRYGQIILSGLLACAAGDLLLLKQGTKRLFLVGMTAFAGGHILFAHAFYMVHSAVNPDGYGDIMSAGAIGAALAVICGISALHICKHAQINMRGPIVIYAVLIWAVIAMAVFTQSPLLILAAAMFAVSDFFVGRDRFITQKPWHALAITPLYFGAQALFALSAANAL